LQDKLARRIIRSVKRNVKPSVVEELIPVISEEVFLAEDVVIIGDVHIKEKSSVWYNVTIRGDVSPIRIGIATNIQDNTVIHGTYEKFGVNIGDRVTVGHSVLLHGCEIGDECLIGMGSILMDGVVIGAGSIVGAGSLVTQGTQVPERSLVLGRPAKVVRPLSEEEYEKILKSADYYQTYQTWYKK
jgi:gamma-carbonic anhydrase